LTLSNCASKSETANSINIYGADSIKGQLTDDTQLNAVENTGKDVTSDCT
jgi:hypothetical protein